MSSITNEQIVAQARTWLGTKYHHQGRLKKGDGHQGGCDCVGLVLGVAAELGMRDKHGELPATAYDATDYSMLPKGQWMLELVTSCAERIPLDQASLGDVLILKFTDNPQHLGIISDYPQGGFGLIHCYSRSGKVVEQPLSPATWQKMAVAAVRLNRKRYG